MPPVFGRYRDLINADISAYSEVLNTRWQHDFGFETTQILDSYLKILSRGGKRLRGCLGMWAYDAAGGTDATLALRIARNLEMIHAYLLVVDDVADLAETRRGGPSAHKLIEALHTREKWFGDARHFSHMQAVNAGLAAQHLVMQEISELATRDVTKLEGLRELSAVLFKTVIGQIADLKHQAVRNITEKEVIVMMKNKTAYYSFVSPLQFGVITAGKDWSDYQWLERWALNIGLGFQINDDILGVFGNEKMSGKSNLDDIREGKITLLIVRALARASNEQQSQLLGQLGNPAFSNENLVHIQAILEDCGALRYCQGLVQSYTKKAIASLDSAPAEYHERVNCLKELSQLLANRHA